jgi:hypothetical protein
MKYSAKEKQQSLFDLELGFPFKQGLSFTFFEITFLSGSP